jgi:hypothetical protein
MQQLANPEKKERKNTAQNPLPLLILLLLILLLLLLVLFIAHAGTSRTLRTLRTEQGIDTEGGEFRGQGEPAPTSVVGTHAEGKHFITTVINLIP